MAESILAVLAGSLPEIIGKMHSLFHDLWLQGHCEPGTAGGLILDIWKQFEYEATQVEEEIKKHGSNNMGLSENLTDCAAAGNGDDGLILQRKSRKPENQQFPGMENEEYHR
ncbi:POTE ankyrin domain family member B [Symphalangus syndactylus]|uniref:POTE ankyrin domain family member B n=1 Tax=Symphalangus syndactylus TaxID=9590 RepID=UPI0030060E3C